MNASAIVRMAFGSCGSLATLRRFDDSAAVPLVTVVLMRMVVRVLLELLQAVAGDPLG